MLKTNIVLFLFLVIFTATFANAQDPTLAETLEYIKSKVNNSGCVFEAYNRVEWLDFDRNSYEREKWKDEGLEILQYNHLHNYDNKINFEVKNVVVEETIKIVEKKLDIRDRSFPNATKMNYISSWKKEDIQESQSINNIKLNLADLDAAEIKINNEISSYSENYFFGGRVFKKNYYKSNWISGRCLNVRLQTFNKENKILSTIGNIELMGKNGIGFTYPNEDKEQKLNYLYLYFSDEDTATRVAKAFTHAIKLSGGKKELF